MTRPRLIAGCMTGTSIDALDVALVQVSGTGMSSRPVFIRGLSRDLPQDLAAELRALADQSPRTAGQIASLSRDFSLFHASAIRDLAGPDRLDLVAAHGQTIFHAPPVSWQMLTPAVIAADLRAPVVSDLRAVDLALGGQGAPITPLADWFFFRHLTQPGSGPVAIANLGGFCNITLLPSADSGPDQIRGRDVCPCNQLLDHIARTCLHAPYDKDGAAALAGKPNPSAAAALRDLFRTLLSPGRPRSLGTGDELRAWADRHAASLSPSDMAATACSVIGAAIAESLTGAGLILLAGGGVRNTALVRTIRSASAAPVAPVDDHGLPSEFREAAEMALLGALCQDRVPITIPEVTGLPRSETPPLISGTWVLP